MSVLNTVSPVNGVVTLPAGAASQMFFVVMDVNMTMDCDLVMPPGTDGQKIGVRFWEPTSAGYAVTFPANCYTGIIGNGGVMSTTALDYIECVYCEAMAKWAVVSVNQQLIPLP